MDETLREYHDVSMIFPMMGEEEFQTLKEDIKTNGLLEPIWIDADGKIIDGRNRHKACIETNTPMKFKVWNNGQSLVSFVVSLNLKRRHLSASQRAACALDIKPMLEEEARRRQIELAGTRHDDLVELIPQGERGKSRDQAGEMFGVSGRYVAEAETVKEKAPDLFEQVKSGEISLTQAKRETVKRERPETPELPAGKYGVIYADPPWQYSNSGFYNAVETQYTTMTEQELINLDVRDLCDESSVLFLWATNPLLDVAMRVMEGWGFTYKTNFVWVKDKARGFAWWAKSKHEILLVGTKPKSGTPVQSAESAITTSRPNEHSKKPETFYELIETLFPNERKIELFARNKRDGWDVWGNEV